MSNPMRVAYRTLVPRRLRELLYRTSHVAEYRRLRTAVFPSPKGTFSLRRCDEVGAIFIHTPKAAGTAIATSIFGELPYHYTALEYRTIFGRRDFERLYKFTFVRNPWDRVLSAYSYLRNGGWNEEDRRWAERHLTEFASFDDFVLRGLKRPVIRDYIHFRPQHEFICDLFGRPLVDFIGRFERIDEDYRAICARLGISSPLQESNIGFHRDYRVAFTAEMIHAVERHYRADIKMFRYTFAL